MQEARVPFIANVRVPIVLFFVSLRVSAVQFSFVFLGGLGVPLKGVLKRILAVRY
jgi:hypothetical protein